MAGGLATGKYEVRDADGVRVGPLYGDFMVAEWKRAAVPDGRIFYVTSADAGDEHGVTLDDFVKGWEVKT